MSIIHGDDDGPSTFEHLDVKRAWLWAGIAFSNLVLWALICEAVLALAHMTRLLS